MCERYFIMLIYFRLFIVFSYYGATTKVPFAYRIEKTETLRRPFKDLSRKHSGVDIVVSARSCVETIGKLAIVEESASIGLPHVRLVERIVVKCLWAM